VDDDDDDDDLTSSWMAGRAAMFEHFLHADYETEGEFEDDGDY